MSSDDRVLNMICFWLCLSVVSMATAAAVATLSTQATESIDGDGGGGDPLSEKEAQDNVGIQQWEAERAAASGMSVVELESKRLEKKNRESMNKHHDASLLGLARRGLGDCGYYHRRCADK